MDDNRLTIQRRSSQSAVLLFSYYEDHPRERLTCLSFSFSIPLCLIPCLPYLFPLCTFNATSLWQSFVGTFERKATDPSHFYPCFAFHRSCWSNFGQRDRSTNGKDKRASSMCNAKVLFIGGKKFRGSDWLIRKETPICTRIFVSTVVFVTYTDPNDVSKLRCVKSRKI